MTGIDAPYEPPESPELRLDAGNLTADLLADQVVDSLVRAGKISASQ